MGYIGAAKQESRKVGKSFMRFGLFGSATARHGGPDADSGQGYRQFVEYNVEAEALGYHSTFLVEPGAVDLGGGENQNAPPWHGGFGAAVAQSGAARRAGRDHRSSLRRPARFRRRQRLSAQRIRRLLHSDARGRCPIQ